MTASCLRTLYGRARVDEHAVTRLLCAQVPTNTLTSCCQADSCRLQTTRGFSKPWKRCVAACLARGAAVVGQCARQGLAGTTATHALRASASRCNAAVYHE